MHCAMHDHATCTVPPLKTTHKFLSNDAPVAEIFSPVVWPEMITPTLQALHVDRLMAAGQVADVVIAGKAQHRGGKFGDTFAAESEIRFHICTVNRQVAGVNDEIRLLFFNPRNKGCPIAVEVRLGWAEVGVGNLDDTQDGAPCWIRGALQHVPFRHSKRMAAALRGLLCLFCDKSDSVP